MGTIEKDFRSLGKRPEERARLMMIDKGRSIEGEVYNFEHVCRDSTWISGLVREQSRDKGRDRLFRIRKKDSGHLGGGETGGMRFRGGAEELKHVAK